MRIFKFWGIYLTILILSGLALKHVLQMPTSGPILHIVALGAALFWLIETKGTTE